MARTDRHARQLLNSLRMSEQELVALVGRLREGGGDDGKNSGRQHTRFDYVQPVVILSIEHPGGNRVEIPVASINLSRRGIGLIHSAYVHEGSRCTIRIGRKGEPPLSVPGEVVRCMHRGGRVHEIGVRFDTEIDARSILSLSVTSESWSCENVNPARLTGRVLVVDDDDLIQRLVPGLLKPTSLSVEVCGTADGALERHEGCDLILCDFFLGDATGESLVARLRERGSDQPVIMMTARNTPEIRERIAACGATSFLSKPFTRETLLRALAEFLLAREDADPLASGLPEGDERRRLIPAFHESLPDLADELEAGMAEGDPDRIGRVCRAVIDEADALGLEALVELAREAAGLLAGSENTEAAMPKLSELADVFRRADAQAA
ncbi:MAG: response regulator [Phycisphaerales bacterium JB040]